jgi:hypothetical protein
MKIKYYSFKTALFIGFLFLGMMAFSQGQVNSLQIFPTSPTSADSITVNAVCSFTGANCVFLYANKNVNADSVVIDAFHCTDLIPSGCGLTDIVKMGPLSPGNYTLKYHLLSKWMCSGPPQFYNFDTAEISFTVTLATGISEVLQTEGIRIFPNPNDGTFEVSNFSGESELLILSADGRLLQKLTLLKGKNEFALDLAKGLYFAIFNNEGSFTAAMPLSIIR